jgi:phosphomevalonate kinase
MVQIETSCPGKVLLAGGYLVLDPLYSGLVIATDDARIHISLSSSVIAPTTSPKSSKIRITSPQASRFPSYSRNLVYRRSLGIYTFFL